MTKVFDWNDLDYKGCEPPRVKRSDVYAGVGGDCIDLGVMVSDLHCPDMPAQNVYIRLRPSEWVKLREQVDALGLL